VSQDDRHPAGDFEFLMGSWRIRNRQRRRWLDDCAEWDEFDATGTARPILEGLGNIDDFRTAHQGGFTGMTLRLFAPETRQWAIYWASTRRPGVLEPPVIGTFTDGTGVFMGDDTYQGRPIVARFTWSGTATATPRWEQAFSPDGGASWETNWVMDFSPA
jgi:hypothetical protein